jgi:hypothetical protein
MTFDEIWAAWFAEHPNTLASWRHQNGYLPMGHDPYLDREVTHKPVECPPGVHSMFDFCPGDCGLPVADD